LALGLGEVLTFSIVANNPSNAFAIDSATGQLSVTNALNPAVQMPASNIPPQYDVMLGVRDAGIDGPSYSAFWNITINVTAVHFPPVLMPYNFSVPELSVNGTTVGTVGASSLSLSSLLTMTYSIAPKMFYANFPFTIATVVQGPQAVGIISVAQGAAVGTFSDGPKVRD
jgi:hypothetical protein